MISGFDRYFQIARRFRDEDCATTANPSSRRSTSRRRSSRVEDVCRVVETLLVALWAEAGHAIRIPSSAFPTARRV
jgi:aspartyl-tRNA synthetase